MSAQLGDEGPPDGALWTRAVARRRAQPTSGISRRTLLRRTLGLAAGVTAFEGLAAMISFVWPTGARSGSKVRVGTLADLIAANAALPIADGFPAFVPDARAFIMTIDPARGSWTAGVDPTGDGTALNVRAVSQRCPHLGCRPNPCVEDFWFRCPCHQSRYDRLGIKAAGVAFGPAARGMDRYPIEVDQSGVLIVDTSRVALGPLPVALGQPGLIPPRVPSGCT
ncbi:MAG: Rieske 2Fe-2S domain-containing protein [Candidatus Limnocylindrales bacterium]